MQYSTVCFHTPSTNFIPYILYTCPHAVARVALSPPLRASPRTRPAEMSAPTFQVQGSASSRPRPDPEGIGLPPGCCRGKRERGWAEEHLGSVAVTGEGTYVSTGALGNVATWQRICPCVNRQQTTTTTTTATTTTKLSKRKRNRRNKCVRGKTTRS